MKNIKNTLLYCMLSAVTILMVTGCGNPEKKDTDSATATSTLSFSLPNLAGEIQTLSSFKKDIIIIDFWTTWCPPCRESIPHLNAFYAANNKHIDIVGISLDDAPVADVDAFVKAMHIEYPILTGGKDLAITLGVSSIPTIIVINKTGKILRRHVGMSDSRVLEDLIKGL